MRHLSHEYNVSLEIFTIEFFLTVIMPENTVDGFTQAQVGNRPWLSKIGGILSLYTMCMHVFFYDIEMI